jgi:membrane associated rhomboid family serine protease
MNERTIGVVVVFFVAGAFIGFIVTPPTAIWGAVGGVVGAALGAAFGAAWLRMRPKP